MVYSMVAVPRPYYFKDGVMHNSRFHPSKDATHIAPSDYDCCPNCFRPVFTLEGDLFAYQPKIVQPDVAAIRKAYGRGDINRLTHLLMPPESLKLFVPLYEEQQRILLYGDRAFGNTRAVFADEDVELDPIYQLGRLLSGPMKGVNVTLTQTCSPDGLEHAMLCIPDYET